MFHGLYINLDKRVDRRAHMEREFAHFGLGDRYRRLRATVDQDGVRGCYRSHMRALEEARRLGGLVHILEDDSILSAALEPYMTGSAAALLERFDMLFLDMWVDGDDAAVARYETSLASSEGFLSLGEYGPRIGCTSSYVVAPRFVGKLHKLLRYHESFHRPVDDTYNRLAKSGEITAAVVVPFLTGVDLATGTSSDVQVIPSADQRMYVMLRTRFFVDKSPHRSI